MIDYWLLIFGMMGAAVVLGLLTVALPSLWAAHKRARLWRRLQRGQRRQRMEFRALLRRFR